MPDRRLLAPDFRDADIVHDDLHVLVIDKPPGVPSQAIDADRGDDVVSRLSGRWGKLGVHQRLDRDTSGLMIFAKTPEANLMLARAFEAREVDKRYRAIVCGPIRDGTLRDGLVRGEHGRMKVVPRADDVAITHVRTLEARGDRRLIEARIETGKTHQIRAQLASRGAPIAGDRLYGGTPAPRLMLHASQLSIGDRTFEREPPEEFATFLETGAAHVAFTRRAIDRAIARAIDLRFALVHSSRTTAFRLVHDGDAIAGVAVDVYGEHLVAHFYDEAALAHRELVLDALDSLGFRGVYMKSRPKQANLLDDAARIALAPPHAVRGEDAPETFAILERDVAYEIALGEGLPTGLYLDQRDNRARVADLAAGRTLLNLFSYTCGFTAAAAARGAIRTLSVDSSARALARGQVNVAAAQSSGDHRFLKEDAFVYLARRRADRFDVVVLDPPTYASSKAHRFRSGRDWIALAASAMRLVADGGVLFASSNDERLPRAKLRRYLHDAAREAQRTVRQMKDMPDPTDFPPTVGEEPHLKAVLVRF